MFRRNADADLRELQRRAAASGDPEDQARFIIARLRAGEIPTLYVEIAAELGHPVARLVFPNLQMELRRSAITNRWWDWDNRAYILQRLGWIDHLVIRVAVEFVRHVLPIWEKFNDDRGPHRVVNAVIQYIEDPQEGDALYIREVIIPLATRSYNLTYFRDEDRIREGLRTAPDAHVANITRELARSVEPDRGPVFIADSINIIAAGAIEAATQPGTNNARTECEWQANFLAEVLLGLRQI